MDDPDVRPPTSKVWREFGLEDRVKTGVFRVAKIGGIPENLRKALINSLYRAVRRCLESRIRSIGGTLVEVVPPQSLHDAVTV